MKKAEQRSRAGESVEQGDIDKLKRDLAGAHRILTFARDLVQYAKPAGSQPEVVSLSSGCASRCRSASTCSSAPTSS